MIRPLALCSAAVCLAGLAACATGERLSAAGDVRSLLIAIRDNDRPAFDAHVDCAALEGEMQAILIEQAKASGLGSAGTTLGVLASGPLAHTAARIVLRPDVFRAIADYYGYRSDQPIPGAFALAAVLSPAPEGRVCARDARSGACLLSFAQEDGAWKLVAFDASRAGLAPRSAAR